MRTSHTNAITAKRGPVFATVTCTICGDKIDAGSAFKDKTGRYWCLDHEKRGKLLNRAAELGYPAISFTGAVKQHYPVQGLPNYIAPTRYAIGFVGNEDNASLWLINALHGANDVIDAALFYIEQGNENDA